MKHGKVRERPKVENISGQKYKMIIIFTNSKSASTAIQEFPTSELAEEYQRKNIPISLNYFHSKDNKIYAAGIKEMDDKVIKEAFESFGEISEFTVSKIKKSDLLTAVVGYVNE
jgi:5S rRNA maturation endonuclease (ribonuclease M5)